MVQYTNTIDIQHYLPHRAPMLMVDFILELTDCEVKTVLEIRKDNIFVSDGIFAEIGLIENAAQTCSAIVGQSFFLNENKEVKEGVKVIGFISGIKKVKVYASASEGDTLNTHSTLMSRFDNEGFCICTMNSSIYVNDLLIFESEMNLFIQEN